MAEKRLKYRSPKSLLVFFVLLWSVWRRQLTYHHALVSIYDSFIGMRQLQSSHLAVATKRLGVTLKIFCHQALEMNLVAEIWFSIQGTEDSWRMHDPSGNPEDGRSRPIKCLCAVVLFL